MFTLVTCLLIAALLPIVAKAPVALAMHQRGGYNNKHPRMQQSELKGFGARALAAHHNAFEALIMFTPAALAAMVVGNISPGTEIAAVIFVVARVAYNICYLLNKHALRSSVWVVAICANFFIFGDVLFRLF